MLRPKQSFIVQIDGEPGRSDGRLEGRAENVATGEVRRFRSAETLLEILCRGSASDGWQKERNDL